MQNNEVYAIIDQCYLHAYAGLNGGEVWLNVAGKI